MPDIVKRISLKNNQGGYTNYDIGADATNVVYDNSTNIKDKIDEKMEKGVDRVTAGQRANITLGMNATAEGYDTVASGITAHAEGQSTIASNHSSHAEGLGTTASGDNSHAEGAMTIASGLYSHAEGSFTSASGNYSHTEGDNTIASGKYSHSEGYKTNASEIYAHAEGFRTTASKEAAHAECYNTIASGFYAHAEGKQTTASGYSSHAEGDNTIAGYRYQHVQGKYNDNKENNLFEIGNGTADNARFNAFEVDQDGNVKAGGEIIDGDGNKLSDIDLGEYKNFKLMVDLQSIDHAPIAGFFVQHDGDDLYQSNGDSDQQKFNRSTNKQEFHSQNVNPYGDSIQTDGTDIYYSRRGYGNYKLNKTTTPYTQDSCTQNVPNLQGTGIQEDDEGNIYYCYYTDEVPSQIVNQKYKLNKNTNTQEEFLWNKEIIQGQDIQTDGNNIYCSMGSLGQYKLDKTTTPYTWVDQTQNGIDTSILMGYNIQTDGEDIYYSQKYRQEDPYRVEDVRNYKLNKSNSTQESIEQPTEEIYARNGGNSTMAFEGMYIQYDRGETYLSNFPDSKVYKFIKKSIQNEANVSNGVAVLDDNKKIYLTQLPLMCKNFSISNVSCTNSSSGVYYSNYIDVSIPGYTLISANLSNMPTGALINITLEIDNRIKIQSTVSIASFTLNLIGIFVKN